MKKLTIGSLCSGYGGLDLAIEAEFECRNVFGQTTETTDTGTTILPVRPLESEAEVCGWTFTYRGPRCPRHDWNET